MEWYYSVNGQRQGPISEAEFAQRVQSGVIREDTLVWRAGMSTWQPYGQVAAAGEGSPPLAPAEPTAESATGGEGGVLPLQFTGKWEEYFKIWIVNVLLTIATLGIYAAWAKVRKRRYFYANTTLLGHAFEYLADPRRILVGNLIVVAAFVAYAVSSVVSPVVQLGVLLLLGLAAPWLIVRALHFNARNSAWRGLRFHFHGRYGQSFVVWFLLGVASVLTLGLLHPYAVRERRHWMVTNHAYGASRFSFAAPTKEFYRIYLIGALFFLPLASVYFTMIALALGRARQMEPGTLSPELGILGVLFFIGLPLAVIGVYYVRSRLFNLVWNHTSIDGHRFVATMQARKLIGIYLLNTLVVAATAGLMHPWAAIRMAAYQLACLQVAPQGSLDQFVADAQAQDPGALGDAASDFFDFDIGLGL